MARPRLHPFWIKRIREEQVATPGIRAPTIAENLSERLANETLKIPPHVPAKVPDERTIRKIVAIPLDDHTRATYRRFQWPESMIERLLPWEASRSALKLLAEFKSRGWPNPTNDQALWFWRLTLAAPHLPISDLIEDAVQLAEIGEMNVSEMAGIARAIESRLIKSEIRPRIITYNGEQFKCHQCGLIPKAVDDRFTCESCGGALVFIEQPNEETEKPNEKGKSRGRKRSAKAKN